MELTPNGEWQIMGIPFPGVPLVKLQRVRQLMLGYAWNLSLPDYSGPVGFVYAKPLHQYHPADATLLGSVGRHMPDCEEVRVQLAPFWQLERYKQEPTPGLIRLNKRKRRKK